jgi:hypothetical protein
MEIKVRHGATTSNTVATVNLGHDADTVEVVNRGAADLYFRFDGENPTVAGNDTEIVTPGTALEVARRASGNAVVKLVSASGVAYTVRGVKR